MMFLHKAVLSLFLATSVAGYSFTARPAGLSQFSNPASKLSNVQTYKYSSGKNGGASSLSMISTGDDRSERKSLDISKTQYTSLVKAPKDAYIAFAEKGKSNTE
jgi:hypothetical protein